MFLYFPQHAAINLFLRTYTDLWLNDENSGQEVIIDHLTMTFEEAEMKKSEPEEESAAADQLTQLIHMFSQVSNNIPPKKSVKSSDCSFSDSVNLCSLP